MYYGEIRRSPICHLAAILFNPAYRAWAQRQQEREELRLRLLSNSITIIKR